MTLVMSSLMSTFTFTILLTTKSKYLVNIAADPELPELVGVQG